MRLRHEVREQCLHVEVGGAFDPAASRSAIEEMLRACMAAGLKRVLVDARRLEVGVSISERFALGRALAGSFPPQFRIAVLVDAGQMTTKTLENSATNRGMSVRTTASPEEAYGFLGLAPPA
jgi:hypothetical protein